ncbi:MAG: addiction module protein [Myxococcota bacterium]|jgi:putative addiction module component (TIGR02574 family)
MARLSRNEIDRLPVAERIRLLEDLWDSIAANPELLPVTEEQRSELDRRLALHRAEPEAAIPYSKLRTRITQEE